MIYSYDEYFCHELNLFLFIKDKEFFDEIAKPMIASKLRKDMMDYFFLNDMHNLQKFKQQNLFNKLNPLEKVLLVFTFNNDKDLHQNALTYFINTQATIKISAQKMDKLLRRNSLFLMLSLHVYNLMSSPSISSASEPRWLRSKYNQNHTMTFLQKIGSCSLIQKQVKCITQI